MQDDIEELAAHLRSHKNVAESYILIREVRIWSTTKTGQSYEFGIKVYRAPGGHEPYTFETSHHVHTPTQATPYVTSVNYGSSESAAIDGAIRTISPWIDSAIDQGHQFSDNWLVKNEDY